MYRHAVLVDQPLESERIGIVVGGEPVGVGFPTNGLQDLLRGVYQYFLSSQAER